MVAAETPEASASCPILSISSVCVSALAIRRVAGRLRLRGSLASREKLLLLGLDVRTPGRAAFLERRHLLGRVAGRLQHLHGVLAEGGCRPFDARRRAGELDREAELADLSELRLFVGDHHLALADKLGLERLV